MLESLKEFTTSTFNTAMNRVKNPAFGAFAISWCAFNWKQILYLFFADNGIYYKIEYISQNSSWWNVIILPVISSLVLCIGLPWINNAITKLQSKPLDNADSLENYKQARMIRRSTRLQRLKAKHDVTYDRVKTGDEKDIQTMKEEITKSQDRMGELTKEKDELQKKHDKVINDYNQSLSTNSELGVRLEKISTELRKLQDENKDIKLICEYYKLASNNTQLPSILEEQLPEAFSRQAEREKSLALNGDRLLF
ncbi:hypothetical protein LNN75_18075 [Klebsiella pneumoniae subsp. pneumoniae]|uniref:hypothetical protein n=1 Tax=Klebsiella pneumoniae TaxID=573 RepID=UPI0019579AB6|nr:hypothetical protein [Klebsiella pneumoniae]EKU0188316.1 hypothetical protein [Klebsiella pneumoniae]MCS6060361.1 hypothetical protein [Klebsiella pneumoniae subsp. pneumoniae]QRU18707.1 hypothetical protein I6K36_24145 [Klebsiella pneumoniae]